MVKVPGDDFHLEQGICPECGKKSFTNAMGTRYCIYCGWWDKGGEIKKNENN